MLVKHGKQLQRNRPPCPRRPRIQLTLSLYKQPSGPWQNIYSASIVLVPHYPNHTNKGGLLGAEPGAHVTLTRVLPRIVRRKKSVR